MPKYIFTLAISAFACITCICSAADQLIAHYTFDQADYVNGIYLDVSGNGNHAIANQPPSAFAPAVNGNTTGAIDLYENPHSWATAGAFDTGSALTISAWVKMNENASIDTCITAKQDSSTSWDNAKWDFIVQPETDSVWVNLSTNLSAKGVLDPAGRWQHLCLTIDTAGNAILYKNAQPVASYSDRHPGSDNNGIVSIGARANGTAALQGALDDLRIYNYPLTFKQVAQLYVDQTNQSICGDRPEMDFNNDCIVDCSDLAIFASHWLEDGLEPLVDNGSLPSLPANQSWSMIWNDEFEGSQIDLGKWTVQGDWQRKGGWWMQNNVWLDNTGNLVIRTQKDGDRYTTGAVWSRGKFEHKQGYWECRAQLPTQPGHWSAFWIQCDGTGAVGNQGTDGTEIDVMEFPWRDGRIQHALHWDGYGDYHQSDGFVSMNPQVLEGWHRFGVWWKQDEYIFYVDGRETWRTSAGGVSQVPEFAYLSSEIGTWAGDITKAQLPDFFKVDYVRVYEVVSH